MIIANPTILINGPLHFWLLEQTEKHFKSYRLWEQTDRQMFFEKHGKEIDGLVTTSGLGANKALINALPNLKVISSMGVGFDSIDVAYAKQKGIIVANTPNVLNEAVADLAMALLLDVARGTTAGDRFIRTGKWQDGRAISFGHDPKNKVCGIVGLGRVGKALAKRVEAFNMQVAYYGRTQQKDVVYPYYNNLIELAKVADFLVLVVPGGSDTRHLVNAEVLAALGANGYLINIARGSIVDEQALIAALQQGIIAGAGLDVFEYEPNVPEALYALDNVVLTPHIGSATVETRHAMASLVLENIQSYFTGLGVKTPVI